MCRDIDGVAAPCIQSRGAGNAAYGSFSTACWNWRIRIHDILAAINAIAEYTRGMDYRAFAADQKTIDAVLRNITVIGEAASRIPDEVTMTHPEIPWRDMRDMRNLLVHEYFGVSTQILWDTVQENLPSLVPSLGSVIGQKTP